MKLSLCTIGDRDEELETIVAQAAELGYAGVELWETHIRRYAEKFGSIDGLAGLLRSHGIAATAISSYRLFLDQGQTDGQPSAAAYAGEVLRWSAALGGAPVRILADWIGSDRASEAERRLIACGLADIARMAAGQGVDIWLETHPGQLTDTTSSTLLLLKEIGMGNVRVNLDIFNLYEVGEDPVEALGRLLPFVSNVHLKNGTLAGGRASYGKLLAEGDMDYAPFLKRLSETGYDGYMGIEWFGDRFWEAAAREIAWLRKTWRSPR